MDQAVTLHADKGEAKLPPRQPEERTEERARGLTLPRHFTRKGLSPYSTVEWVKRDVLLKDKDGAILFEQCGVEVASEWSEEATQVLASKYFRRAGVPGTEGEASLRQVVHRLVSTWRHFGEDQGYFRSQADAEAFEDEVAFMLLHQMAAPNSPQWFNTGLSHVYGIKGPKQGHWYVDQETGETREAIDAYSHPQVHACFIQPVADSLHGITELLSKEARLSMALTKTDPPVLS